MTDANDLPGSYEFSILLYSLFGPIPAGRLMMDLGFNFAAPAQNTPQMATACVDDAVEHIRLLPYGATHLRLTIFPGVTKHSSKSS